MTENKNMKIISNNYIEKIKSHLSILHSPKWDYVIELLHYLFYTISMNYSFIEDLEYAKEALCLSDVDFYSLIKTTKTTYYRWKKNNYIPDKKQLDIIYGVLYKKGIDFNRIKEEVYLSLQNENTKILFHGSKNGIDGEISTQYGNENRDFGKGFYVGESVKQSVSFVCTYPDSSLYCLKLKNYKKIRKIEFDVSSEWMILVAYYRNKIKEYANSNYVKSILKKIKGKDLIIAPIADNTMYSIINEFVEGSITDEQCLNCLSANRLGKQYVFLNDKIIKDNLEIVSKMFISSNEKEDYSRVRLQDDDIGKKKVVMAKRKYAGVGKYIEELLVD